MSSGETDSKKKPGRTKLAWEALKLMESLGCKTIEEFHAKVAALHQPDLAALEAEAPMEPIEEPVTMDATVEDCLGWIDKGIDVVWLVIKSMTLSLRPSRPFMDPPMEQIMISSAKRDGWPNMPFDVRGRNDRETLFNRVNYAEWGHFAISRDLAEQVYGHRAFPIPTEAIIVPQEARGWSTYSHAAMGKKRSLGENPDPLRECVRRALQRFPGRLFINSRHHPEMPQPWIVNPYGNSLGTLRPRVIRDNAAKVPEFKDKGEVPLDIR